MNKIFYKLDIDTSQNYSDLSKFINLVSEHNIKCSNDNAFLSTVGVKGFAVNIEAKDKEKFEQLLYTNNIRFESLNLSEKYYKYCLNTFPKKEKLDDTFIDGSEDIIISIEIPQIIDGPNGKQFLTEGTIARKDQIKIYTHSNERCGHHKPHVHCAYGDDNNYCVISLCSLEVIQPSNYKSARVKKIIEIVTQNLDKCRLAWNKTSGLLKFKLDADGKPINELITE